MGSDRVERMLERHRKTLKTIRSVDWEAVRASNRAKALDAKAKAEELLADAEAGGDAERAKALRQWIAALELDLEVPPDSRTGE